MSLRSVVVGQVSGRGSDEAIAIFEAHGIRMSDVQAEAYVYKKAKENGLGTELTLSP